jgi:hypothetical protein
MIRREDAGAGVYAALPCPFYIGWAKRAPVSSRHQSASRFPKRYLLVVLFVRDTPVALHSLHSDATPARHPYLSPHPAHLYPSLIGVAQRWPSTGTT